MVVQSQKATPPTVLTFLQPNFFYMFIMAVPTKVAFEETDNWERNEERKEWRGERKNKQKKKQKKKKKKKKTDIK